MTSIQSSFATAVCFRRKCSGHRGMAGHHTGIDRRVCIEVGGAAASGDLIFLMRGTD
jgi:hypothetical protein